MGSKPRVLTYLNNLTPLASLTLEKLTYKFVVLLALISSQRVQTLTKVKLSNITYFEDKIEIKITDIIKTSAPGKCQPILTLPYFHENPNLCIATILKYYIDTTQQYRNSHDQLLITIKKPHHPASAQTVAKWIKKGLALGGVNTDIFKSHSTRHASTSAAFKKGLSIESIRRTAGWSEKSSTFNKFYNRPLSQNKSFAEYLLNEKLSTAFFVRIMLNSVYTLNALSVILLMHIARLMARHFKKTVHQMEGDVALRVFGQVSTAFVQVFYSPLPARSILWLCRV
ncbi:hypothetical protein NQ315_004500 [Exocentrus adspersus]|uniref:Tyr recombinase domain-containing protein n=1 Tax=Exocentrus adspersus TaxID=1586481 RepID=A0AAV8VPH4_9CUCU|nr:hypothetical protein NQ315_004500 [Exocentrus adspersus]